MSNVVDILGGAPESQVVDVGSNTVSVIEVITDGPPGPAGPPGGPGPPGPSGAAFSHTQSTPATVWTITHDLGYNPGGLVVVADGFIMDDFGIQYLTAGESLRLTFDVALAGVAYLS